MPKFLALALSGLFFLASQAAATPTTSASLLGQWGGDRAHMSFTANGAQLDLECAAGNIAGPVRLSRDGRFDTLGRFEQLRGGPQRVDDQPQATQARYAGRLEGKTLTLQVWPVAGEAPLEFKLRKGVQVKMVRCY